MNKPANRNKHFEKKEYFPCNLNNFQAIMESLATEHSYKLGELHFNFDADFSETAFKVWVVDNFSETNKGGVAIIKAYEIPPKAIKVSFLDGYDPYASDYSDRILGSSFEELTQIIIDRFHAEIAAGHSAISRYASATNEDQTAVDDVTEHIYETNIKPWESIPDYRWDRLAVQLLYEGYTDEEIKGKVDPDLVAKTITNRLSVLRKQFPDEVLTRREIKRRRLKSKRRHKI